MVAADVIAIVSVVINTILVISGWFINKDTKKTIANLSNVGNQKNFSNASILQKNKSGDNNIG